MSTLIVTCEHATPHVPGDVRDRFVGADDVLATHRGYDLGALPVAERVAAAFGAPHFAAGCSRLVVDTNRSAHHPRVFSVYTKDLPRDVRSRLMDTWWHPHRDAVERAITTAIGAGHRVVHVAVHSFTPVLDGVVRPLEIGLLYDPSRNAERDVVTAWQRALRNVRPDWRVRRNAPYRGVSDGFPTALRKRFADPSYAGIELELNQGLPDGPVAIAGAIVGSLRLVLR